MYLPFEVNQTYMLVTIPNLQSPGYHANPGWEGDMGKYKGIVMVCTELDAIDDFIGTLVPYDTLDGDDYSFHRTWVVPCKPPVEYPKCICNIWTGCSCGAFQKEMIMKGRTFNPILKMWVPNAV